MAATELIMFVVGGALILIPDPATTAAGVLLVLAAFGMEDRGGA